MPDIDSVLVSIIIPVYNVEDYLRQCVDSVLRQTHRNLEIILVDDGATDKSGEICDEYRLEDKRVTVIHQSNAGLSAARNAGLETAEGKYVYFPDSDDWIRKDAVETLTGILEKTSCDIVLFDGVVADQYGQLTDDPRYKRKAAYPDSSGLEMYCRMQKNKDYYAPTWLTIMKRELLKAEGLRFYPGILHEDELFTFLLMMKANAAAHVKEGFYYRRIRDNSIMTQPISERNLEGLYQAMHGIKKHFDTISDNSARDVILEHICTFFDRILAGYDLMPDSQKDKAQTAMTNTYRFGASALRIGPEAAGVYARYERLIWYGGGERCGLMLKNLKGVFPDEIWDRNAGSAAERRGIPVKKPDFAVLRDRPDWLMVVCIDSIPVWKDIQAECSGAGVQNVCNWRNFYSYHKLKDERGGIDIHE
jgi:glycosyltransferase involved in cell wall biosynthesis